MATKAQNLVINMRRHRIATSRSLSTFHYRTITNRKYNERTQRPKNSQMKYKIRSKFNYALCTVCRASIRMRSEMREEKIH